MLIDIHAFVLARLSARSVPWTDVSRKTGIPYETLKKIASRRTPNPGVQHVQRLAEFFQQLEQAAAPAVAAEGAPQIDVPGYTGPDRRCAGPGRDAGTDHDRRGAPQGV
jgi:hypothetical protein